MSQPIFESLTNSVSVARIGGYIANATPKTCLESTSLYFYNLLLSESLYPAIHLLEITLRNNINEALKITTGQPDWYDLPSLLQVKQITQLAEARAKIAKLKKVETADQIVSELSLGFWVGLFNASYEHTLWRHYPKLISLTVPRASKYLKTRDHVSKRLNPIRDLRNRVFHHEPIWIQNDLDDVHNKLCEVLRWLNPDMAQFLLRIDRFKALRKDNGISIKKELFQSLFVFEEISTL